RDPAMRIGGMNHFMLPSGGANSRDVANEATRYGNFAMEKLINDILKNGGRRDKLEVKIFGGGNVLKNMGMTDIGGKNIAFVREYLRLENLNVVAEDLGDIFPRKVVYDPISGKVQVKKLRKLHNDTITRREMGYRQAIEQAPVAGDIDLFD
ncbi:MAG: chemoreceptor glutamine deamidase CheD, partial [Gammaproteobacteria bacterium]